MPAYRFWRLSQIEPAAKLALELSTLELWGASTRLDTTAVFTCTATPISGTLSNLQDSDLATICGFTVADSNSPGFWFQWDFGVGVTSNVRKILWRSTSDVDKAPRYLVLDVSSDGQEWLHYESIADITPSSPSANVEINLPELAGQLLISTMASSNTPAGAIPGWDVAATTDVRWPINFGETSTLGIFSYATTTTAAVATTPIAAGTFNRFNVADIWDVFASSGYVAADFCSIDIEFLTATDVIKAALSLKTKSGGVFCGYFVGATLGTSLQPTNSTGSVVSGTVRFTNSSIVFAQAGFSSSHACDLSQVTKLRVSNVKAYSSYTTSSGFAQAFIRMRAIIVTGANAALNVRRGALVDQIETSADVYGNTGRIVGTVKEKNAPTNLPLRRRVRLFNDHTTVMEREVWSDAVTGAYSFDNIDIAFTYTVISTDHTGVYRAVIADGLSPDMMP